MRVVGRLKQDRWEDAEGKTRSKVHIIAEHVEFKPKLKGKQDDEAEQEIDQGKGQDDLEEAASF